MPYQPSQLTFWLVPSEEAKTFFASLIHDLARAHEAPEFEPHVTLQGAELKERHAIELLENLAAEREPLDLQVSGVGFSDAYTKTLYVQFHPSHEASALSNAIAQRGGSRDYQFDPHLSLLYKTLPESQKEELARDTRIPFKQVRFEALKLVSVPAWIEGPEDVNAWETIEERRLGGGA